MNAVVQALVQDDHPSDLQGTEAPLNSPVLGLLWTRSVFDVNGAVLQ